MSARRRARTGLVFAVAMGASLAAHAQPTASDKVAAESLFNEARALLAQKKLDEACPKFAASQRLDPAVGTLLNLGDCYEKKGQLASAWLQFREAVSLATSRNDDRRAQTARERATALEPKLARLTIRAAPGIAIERDGAALDRAIVGTQVPIDAGSHAIEASAPGKKSWRTTIVAKDGASLAVDVPELEAGAPAPVAAAPPPPPAPSPPADSSAQGSGQRLIGLIVAGVGVVGLGVGTFFALDARSKWSTVTDKCPDRVCPDPATRDSVASARDDASQSATLGTVGFVAGGALLVGGAVIFLTAPKGASTEHALRVTPEVGRGVAGLSFTGRFQ